MLVVLIRVLVIGLSEESRIADGLIGADWGAQFSFEHFVKPTPAGPVLLADQIVVAKFTCQHSIPEFPKAERTNGLSAPGNEEWLG